jgi:hypothetical protein
MGIIENSSEINLLRYIVKLLNELYPIFTGGENKSSSSSIVAVADDAHRPRVPPTFRAKRPLCVSQGDTGLSVQPTPSNEQEREREKKGKKGRVKWSGGYLLFQVD